MKFIGLSVLVVAIASLSSMLMSLIFFKHSTSSPWNDDILYTTCTALDSGILRKTSHINLSTACSSARRCLPRWCWRQAMICSFTGRCIRATELYQFQEIVTSADRSYPLLATSQGLPDGRDDRIRDLETYMHLLCRASRGRYTSHQQREVCETHSTRLHVWWLSAVRMRLSYASCQLQGHTGRKGAAVRRCFSHVHRGVTSSELRVVVSTTYAHCRTLRRTARSHGTASMRQTSTYLNRKPGRAFIVSLRHYGSEQAQGSDCDHRQETVEQRRDSDILSVTWSRHRDMQLCVGMDGWLACHSSRPRWLAEETTIVHHPRRLAPNAIYLTASSVALRASTVRGLT